MNMNMNLMERRKWEDLEMDCLENVFARLGLDELLLGVPFVCTSWHKTSLLPTCWKNLDLSVLDDTAWCARFKREYCLEKLSSDCFLKFLVSRSHGAVEKLILSIHATSEKLTYVSNECPTLKILDFIIDNVSAEELLQCIFKLLPKWSQLQRLYVRDKCSTSRVDSEENFDNLLCGIKFDRYFFRQFILEISNHCKNFVGLSISSWIFEDLAVAIPACLPKLKYLNLSGSFLTEKILLMNLEGFMELEELYIKDCIGLEVDEVIMESASHLKIFQFKGTRTLEMQNMCILTLKIAKCLEKYWHVYFDD